MTPMGMDARYKLSGMTTISVIPAVGGGDPSEKEQDGFPIKHYEADFV